MSDSVTFNAAKNRYEMDVNGSIVFGNVRRKDGVLYIDYVEAPPELRGTGAAGRFMEALMQIVKAENLKAKPICGYAAGWLRKHNEYKDFTAS